MKAWFISDIHLKSLNERNGNILLRFLLSLQTRQRPVTHLFLLGDIFDLWIGDHAFYYKKFQPIVDLILELKRSGVEVYYFEGNHDVHVKPFWERFNIPCWTSEKYFELAGKRIRVEHGDFINREDMAYKRYRRFVRLPVMEKFAQAMPGQVFNNFGEWASRTSSQYSRRDRANKKEELRSMIRDYARHAYSVDPYDLIVTGHMHVLDDWTFEASGRQVRSINLGSWFEEPKALAVSDQLVEWEDLG